MATKRHTSTDIASDPLIISLVHGSLPYSDMSFRLRDNCWNRCRALWCWPIVWRHVRATTHAVPLITRPDYVYYFRQMQINYQVCAQRNSISGYWTQDFGAGAFFMLCSRFVRRKKLVKSVVEES